MTVTAIINKLNRARAQMALEMEPFWLWSYHFDGCSTLVWSRIIDKGIEQK